jgi:hypothetical protein
LSALGIAIDTSGNSYVVDKLGSRVEKFDSSGSFVDTWGTAGTGDGQFVTPSGIAVDSSGDVYVVDTGNNRIQKFNSSGTFITEWGSAGVGDGQFAIPSGVAVDSTGDVYVADSGNSRIQKFDSSGGFVTKWGSAGTGDGQFGPPATVPLDVAIGASDNVVVADATNNRVEKFRPIGTFITKWGTAGSGTSEFTLPSGVAISSGDEVYAVDQGNNRVQRFHETDTVAPTSSLDSGPSGFSGADVSFTFSSPDGPLLGPGFECRFDAAEWESCGSPKAYSNLSEGSHTFRVRAVDAAGNPDPSPATRTWAVDTQNPQTTIDSGPSGTSNDPSPSFAFSSSEPGSSFECRLDSNQPSDWQSCSSPKAYGSLADGSHSFDVRAIDPAGNTDATPASRSFSVDTQNPQTTINSGPPGTSNNPSPSFAFSSSEPGSSFECRLDSNQPADWQACSSPKAYSSLADGSHSFEVRATDAVGNTDPTPASRSFAIDSGAPAPPRITAINPPSPANDNQPRVKGNAQAGSKVRIYTRIGCVGSPLAVGTVGRFHSSGLSVSVSDDTKTKFRATATDASGNASSCSAAREYVEDSKPPSAPAIKATNPPSPANDNQPLVRGFAEAPSTVRLYSTVGCAGSPVASGPASPFHSHGLPVSVLDDTTTKFRATATDLAGNTSPCSNAWRYVEDSTDPETSIVAGPSGPTTNRRPTFRFESSEAQSTFRCRLDSQPFGRCSGPEASHTPYVRLSLGLHMFAVRATDRAGNVDPTPAERAFAVVP